MQHLLSERRLTLGELAKQQGVSVSTVWRWTMRGVRHVRLESLSIGGRRHTTAEAFERFVITSQKERAPGPVVRTGHGAESERDHDEAERFLTSEGI
ncbi:MAG: hypothetical protein C0485_09575 [Pirellula sp.]|nr:hypothetical protein [Pirellula sp.]